MANSLLIARKEKINALKVFERHFIIGAFLTKLAQLKKTGSWKLQTLVVR